MSPRPSLGSTGERPSLRPDLRLKRPALEGKVNDGRRPPPQAARSVIDGPQSAGQTRKSREPKTTVAHPPSLRSGTFSRQEREKGSADRPRRLRRRGRPRLRGVLSR